MTQKLTPNPITDLLLALAAGLNRQALLTPRRQIIAYGIFENNAEPHYLCLAPFCAEQAKQFEARMPLTQEDLNVESLLYADRRVQCCACGADLVVCGPDPRD